MPKSKQNLAHSKEPKELLKRIKQLAAEIPMEKLGASLKKVAKARGMIGAGLELHFERLDDPYYNVYRYAFFGKVPEHDVQDQPGVVLATGKRVFPVKKVG